MSEDGSVADVWGRLWTQGVAHSFGGTDGVDGWRNSPLTEFWKHELPTTGPAHVLDLCTGNGVLLQTLVNLATTDDVSGVGVDLATVAPQWLREASERDLQKFSVISAVNIESLPFTTCSFDLVVSQFGIEYADLGKALVEAQRVLKPGGRFVGVIHHPSARPVMVAREEIQHIEWVLSQGLLDKASQMCAAMELLNSSAGLTKLNSEPQWLSIRREFDTTYACLSDRIRASVFADFLSDTQAVVRDAFRTAVTDGYEAAVSRLRSFERGAAESRLRLLQMVSSAKTEAQVLEAMAVLPETPSNIGIEPIVVNDALMANCLRFSKAQS